MRSEKEIRKCCDCGKPFNHQMTDAQRCFACYVESVKAKPRYSVKELEKIWKSKEWNDESMEYFRSGSTPEPNDFIFFIKENPKKVKEILK